MMGERVAILRRERTGEDSMGEPLYEWRPEEVSNCLVRPLEGSEMGDPARPDGVIAEYSIALPKTYTSGMLPLRNERVALVDRGMDASDPGEALRVTGSPDVTRPCPTAWDVVVRAGRSYG